MGRTLHQACSFDTLHTNGKTAFVFTSWSPYIHFKHRIFCPWRRSINVWKCVRGQSKIRSLSEQIWSLKELWAGGKTEQHGIDESSKAGYAAPRGSLSWTEGTFIHFLHPWILDHKMRLTAASVCFSQLWLQPWEKDVEIFERITVEEGLHLRVSPNFEIQM